MCHNSHGRICGGNQAPQERLTLGWLTSFANSNITRFEFCSCLFLLWFQVWREWRSSSERCGRLQAQAQVNRATRTRPLPPSSFWVWRGVTPRSCQARVTNTPKPLHLFRRTRSPTSTSTSPKNERGKPTLYWRTAVSLTPEHTNGAPCQNRFAGQFCKCWECHRLGGFLLPFLRKARASSPSSFFASWLKPKMEFLSLFSKIPITFLRGN